MCFEWTHEASQLDPRCSPAATRREIGASKIKSNAPESAFQLKEKTEAAAAAAAAAQAAEPSSSTTRGKKRSGGRATPLPAGPITIHMVGVVPDGVCLVREKQPQLVLARDVLLSLEADSRWTVTSLVEAYQAWSALEVEEE